MIDKKVTLQLVGLNGNAFVLLGAFQGAAKKEGWTKPEIDEVIKEATAKDYNHLLATLLDHCDDPTGDEDPDDEIEDD